MTGSPPPSLFAVTTRSRLKGPWFFPHMMRASMRVREQLAESGDVVRWASIVAGPSEFWTITVWRSRHDMQEFMRTGAHDDIMWQFSRWLRSFWLMRWRPGPQEMGDWNGLSMAQPEPDYERPPMAPARQEALDKALEFLPRLRSAIGSDGAATYESTDYARRRRAEVGGAGGVVIHLRTPKWQIPAALVALRTLRRQAEADSDLLRAVVGVGQFGDSYLLSVWQNRAGATRLLESARLAGLHARWPGHCWANEWLPENEFGHWDGLRLRKARASYTIDVPQSALEVAEPNS